MDNLQRLNKRRKDQELLRKRESETSQERTARLRADKESRAFIDEVVNAFNFRLLGEQVVEGRPAYILEATTQIRLSVSFKVREDVF